MAIILCGYVSALARAVRTKFLVIIQEQKW